MAFNVHVAPSGTPAFRGSFLVNDYDVEHPGPFRMVNPISVGLAGSHFGRIISI